MKIQRTDWFWHIIRGSAAKLVLSQNFSSQENQTLTKFSSHKVEEFLFGFGQGNCFIPLPHFSKQEGFIVVTVYSTASHSSSHLAAQTSGSVEKNATNMNKHFCLGTERLQIQTNAQKADTSSTATLREIRRTQSPLRQRKTKRCSASSSGT